MLVKYTKPNILGIGDLVVLKPGHNDVDPRVWAECEKIALVRFMVEAGTIEVKKVLTVKDVSRMPANEAIALVNEVFTRELLGELKKGETRPVVIAAIEAQVKKITPPEPKPEEKQS